MKLVNFKCEGVEVKEEKIVRKSRCSYISCEGFEINSVNSWWYQLYLISIQSSSIIKQSLAECIEIMRTDAWC